MKKDFKTARTPRELPAVDVRNQIEMIAAGIHPKYQTPRDPDVWTKTKREKQDVKEARNRYGRGIPGRG